MEQYMLNWKNLICLDQFSNPSNPKAHYIRTRRKIFNQLQGNVDIFVASIGSGGTIMGCGKLLKELNRNTKSIWIQPEEDDILNEKFVLHKIQANAVGRISDFFDKKIIDSMISITNKQ
ncbi:pyridoxal-phosphate dependent enzyme [Bacillus gaemokensis]|uniref:Tryptophan synthase beta chain-like PALP domain-containing protein n=1 Tax=Bacillus gaemokensis TaxID=574375 RepID=A0A073KF29_9BACI|nr:pyridoxal-phosphate dependent enzyme [Bacillus gaemokensis]KEK25037.1 hypothetical protein BAGA_18225 [Bacillus gaemokensis]KYG32577.1 hypothetical protein AZF08_10770 [Bacillus gaemokensis]